VADYIGDVMAKVQGLTKEQAIQAIPENLPTKLGGALSNPVKNSRPAR
jgi:hypothetical protein